MTIGALRVEILIPGVRSLKEKRKVIRSLKDKIKNKFNVSIAEVDYSEKWQRSMIGVVQVGNDMKYIEKNLNSIYQLLIGNYNIQVVDRLIEFF
ncbi:MAG: DUF503 domain-containing protein [Calditrichia bacterium]|nr:DUF503 domain-containing protein [Calditrichia bacterium]